MLAAIVQARMGSSRFPGKTLADLEGRPLLEHLIRRVQASRFVKEIVLATTLEPRDDPLVEWAHRRGLRTFRGSETDVLDRVYCAAKQYAVEEIIRVTPDCPLLDPRVMDRVIEVYRIGSYDYVSNTQGRRYPDGLDVEVFSFQALETAWREAREPSQREHVTLYLRTSGRFRVGNVDAPADYSGMKWSVDTPEDLEFVRSVVRRLAVNGEIFEWNRVVELLNKVPDLARGRPGSVTNEGYYLSLAKDLPVPVRPRRLDHSLSLLERAMRRIPGGAQTFSKGPTQFVQGVAPTYLVRGSGCRVWDPDGNEYLDTAMALGSVLLGYGDTDVEEAVRRQLKEGVNFSLPHPLEVELAELLQEMIPCAQMVRFGKNGSDATSGAVRLARASTGRDLIACCGYHGWQDWYIGTTTRDRGVPQAVKNLTLRFDYNDMEGLERLFQKHPSRIAAVILEPIGVVEPKDGFLQQLQDLTRREGALLIFDEVLTGFRFRLGGAQEYFGVIPDLACFGKGMANGFPLSALVGRADLMRGLEEVFFSFTFGGEVLSLAAAVATLSKLRREKGVDFLWAQGKKLQDGYTVLARHFGLDSQTRCMGLAPRTVLMFQGKDEAESLAWKSLFQQECLKRGVLFSGPQNVSVGHGEPEVDRILRVYRSALEILAQAIRSGDVLNRLEGKPVEPVFRQP